jgi:hypothetical protein
MAKTYIEELLTTNDADVLKQIEQAVIMQSVVELPSVDERRRPSGPLVFNIANQADEFIPWGYDLKARDAQLRTFWVTEPILASAIYMMSARMAAMQVEIVGSDSKAPRPRNTIRAASKLLSSADRGKGWQHFISKLMIDVFTQDNGGFIEAIRRDNSPDSPVLGIAHLDAHRCDRTGDPETPVIYRDRKGREHKLAWWQVYTVEDMPSPVEEMYGAQYCALTRALRAAQIIRDITLYKKEKISGQFARAVHFVSGVTRQNVEDGLALAQESMLNRNLARFNPAPIIPTIDPESHLAHVQVDLASLPDGFNEEVTLQWYVTQLAIAFGVDYQEFAPLASGALGSGQQSEVLHLKSRGKGPALGISILEHLFNDGGLLPSNIMLTFKAEDTSGDEGRANARFLRGKDRTLRIDSGELDLQAAREQAVLDGDLTVDMLEELQARPTPMPAPVQQTGMNPNPANAQSIIMQSESHRGKPTTMSADQITGGIQSHSNRKDFLMHE